MRTETTCDECGEKGDWEVGFFDNLKEAKDRPEDWACIVMKKSGRPINVAPQYRVGSGKEYWANPEFCEKHNTDVAIFCPKCFRASEVFTSGEKGLYRKFNEAQKELDKGREEGVRK